MAVRFDVSQSYDAVSDLGAISKHSVSFWFKVTLETDAVTGLFQAYHDSEVVEYNYSLMGVSGDGDTHDLFWSGKYDPSLGIPIASDTWYYVGMAADGVAGTITVTVRAASASAFTTVDLTGMDGAYGANHLFIGNAFGFYGLNGCMSSFKFWNETLSTAELQAESWQHLPNRTANLQYWYPFVQAELSDYSGNGRTLTENGTGFVTDDGPPVSWGSSPTTALWLPAIAAVNKSGSDSGSLTESKTLSTSASKTDSFSVTASSAMSASLSRTDAGTVAESARIATSASESATATDASSISATMASTDTGSLADTGSLSAAWAKTDNSTVLDSSGLSATLSGTDSGTISDVRDLHKTVPFSVTDQGSLSELSSIEQTFGPSTFDVFRVTDGSALTVAFSDSETIVFSDQAQLVDLRTGSETIAFTSSAVVSFSLIDIGGPIEDSVIRAEFDHSDIVNAIDTGSLSYTPNRTDSGLVSESSVLASSWSFTENLVLDQVASVSVVLSSSDTGTIDDDSTLPINPTLSDIGTLTELSNLAILQPRTDSAVLVQSAQVSVTVSRTDAATLGTAATLGEPKSGTDTFVFRQSASVIDTGREITETGRPYRAWRVGQPNRTGLVSPYR